MVLELLSKVEYNGPTLIIYIFIVYPVCIIKCIKHWILPTYMSWDPQFTEKLLHLNKVLVMILYVYLTFKNNNEK